MITNSSQILFWCFFTLMLLAFVGLILLGLYSLKKNKQDYVHPESVTTVFQDQYKELKDDLKRGAISRDVYEKEIEEIRRRILEETSNEELAQEAQGHRFNWISLSLVLLIPFIATCIYLCIGNPSLINYSGSPSKSLWDEKGNFHSASQTEINENQLEQYLKESPKDVRGWVLLSRTYQQKKQFRKALSALDKAIENSQKLSTDANVLAQRAVLMMEIGDPLLKEGALKEIDQACNLEPENISLKELFAMIAFDCQKYKLAILIWSTLLDHYKDDSSRYQQILDAIAEAKMRQEMNWK